MIHHDEFKVHVLNENGLAGAAQIAEVFDKLLSDLEIIIPSPSRELSITKTKLEEACFFAKKAMATREINQL